MASHGRAVARDVRSDTQNMRATGGTDFRTSRKWQILAERSRTMCEVTHRIVICVYIYMYAQSCAHLHNPVHLRNPAQCRCAKVRRQAFPVNPDRFDGGAPQCRARCIRAACNSYVYVYTMQLNTILARISLYEPVYTYISLYKLI